MRKPPQDRMLLAMFALGVITAFATGGFIAKQFVSPCVCAFVASPARIN